MNSILVEGCTFINPRGYIFAARNGNNMIFRNNKVVSDDPAFRRLSYAGHVLVEGGENNQVEAVE